MKGFVTVIGLLTLAQWAFVGLLYGFIHYQDKDSPETLAKLHDLPVVGGYFPKVKLMTQEEKDRQYGDDLRARRLEAQRFYSLPQAWNAEEFQKLSDSLSEKGEQLQKKERELEQRRLEVESMIAEIGRREQNLVTEQAQLDTVAASVLKDQEEVRSIRSRLESTVDDAKSESFRKTAKIVSGMTPTAAKEVLMAAPDNETMKERTVRFDEAAKILTFMDVETAGQIIESMTPTDASMVLERMKSFSAKK